MDDKFSFEDLNVFQESLAFIDNVYKTVSTFPKGRSVRIDFPI